MRASAWSSGRTSGRDVRSPAMPLPREQHPWLSPGAVPELRAKSSPWRVALKLQPPARSFPEARLGHSPLPQCHPLDTRMHLRSPSLSATPLLLPASRNQQRAPPQSHTLLGKPRLGCDTCPSLVSHAPALQLLLFALWLLLSQPTPTTVRAPTIRSCHPPHCPFCS